MSKNTPFPLESSGEAVISMTGEGASRDRVELDEFDVSVPVISKDFRLHWRDLIASRNGGMPIDTMNAENAARQVAEVEDKLLLSGDACMHTVTATVWFKSASSPLCAGLS